MGKPAKGGVMEWFRWYHGAVSDPKWPLIARKAGVGVGVVVSVWAALLEHASQDEERGSVAGFDGETIDALYGYADGVSAAVVEALRHRGVIRDGCISAWRRRQPRRERDDDSAERVRRHRESKRQADAENTDQTDGCSRVTPSNATVTPRNVRLTPRNAQNRTEQNRAEQKAAKILSPQASGNQDCARVVCGAEGEAGGSASAEAEGAAIGAAESRIDGRAGAGAVGASAVAIGAAGAVAGTVASGAAGAAGEFSPAPALLEEPGMEFVDLRDFWDRECRPEGPLSGWQEYKALKAARRWPGISRISQDVEARYVSGAWEKGFAKGLGNYLRERLWLAEVVAGPRKEPRASPRAPTVFQQNMRFKDDFATRELAARGILLPGGGTGHERNGNNGFTEHAGHTCLAGAAGHAGNTGHGYDGHNGHTGHAVAQVIDVGGGVRDGAQSVAIGVVGR